MAFVLPATNPNTLVLSLHRDYTTGTAISRPRKLFSPKRFTSSNSLSTSFHHLSPTVCENSSMNTPSSSSPAGALSLPSRWREVQGSRNWENILDPLDPILRQEVIRYGELVNACYKAFNLDPTSTRYLNCKFGKKNMLNQVGLESSGYRITKYIYATPEKTNIPPIDQSCRGRWIGYVAVSTDEAVKKLGRTDILVSFRGTITNPEWVANFMSSLTPARLDPNHPRPNVKVESGFLSLYTSEETHKFGLDSCRQQLLSEVARLVNDLKSKSMDFSITLAGHSMGSSLALILAYDIAELGLNRSSPVTVFSFAGPRVGNSGFKERCEELGVKVLRIVNVNDPITKLPGVVFNEKFRVLGSFYELPWSYSCYAHVGLELALDFFNMKNPSCVHDLETYINLLRHPAGACGGLMKRGSMVANLESISCRARELVSKAQNFAGVLNVVNQSQRT